MAMATLSAAKRALWARYGGNLGAATGAEGTIVRRRPGSPPAPLSPGQEQLWLRLQAAGPHAPPFYNESITIAGLGAVNVPALRDSLSAIVGRHEIWRTSYGMDAGRAVQIVHPAQNIDLPIVDLQGLPEAAREAEAQRRLEQEVRRPIALAGGPLVRFLLVKLTENEHRLWVIAHQSVVDGMSAFHLFPAELAALYQAHCAGAPSPLAELPLQYGDAAWRQQRWQAGAGRASQLAYWQRQLGGIAMPRWPSPVARRKAPDYRGRTSPFALPGLWTEAVRGLGRRHGVTLFATLVAGLAVVLHQHTGQDTMVLGTYSAGGRRRPEIQGLLGYFLNPVALRLDLGDNPAFSVLLARVQHTVAEAISYDEVPWEEVAGKLAPDAETGEAPRFPVVVSLQPPLAPAAAGWTVTSMDGDNGGAVWDLYLAFIDWGAEPGPAGMGGAAGLIGRAQYKLDVHDAGSVTSLLGDLRAALAHACQDPQRRVAELAIS
ncbi:MAG: condensation domain-containing protein [Terriglobales bacterium]